MAPLEIIGNKPFWRFVALAALVYLGICVLLFFAQRRLIYLPSRGAVPLPPGFTEWRSPSGDFWGYKRIRNGPQALFFFHGNGGNASGWSHAVTEFPGDVFVLEYPGYGSRPGSPSESLIKSAALRAFQAEYARYATVAVCGQSLGSAVTEAIFRHQPADVDTLVLITPFVSLSKMARSQFAWFPTRLILRDKMELFEAWQKFPGRSVVVIAAHDEIIPRDQSLRYAAAVRERPAGRRLIEVDASHNTIHVTEELWRAILEQESSSAPPPAD